MNGYIKNINIGKKNISIDDEVIIRADEYIYNLSRVPLSYTGDDRPTIIDLLFQSKKKYEEINQGTKYEDLNGVFFVIILLAARLFLHKGEPLKVAEIGCNSGALSMYMAPLLKAFDPDAEYICVSNAIGNESGVEWVDRISMVDAPSGLSFLVSDFHNTKLRDDYFDLTIINGTQRMPLPLESIKEASRITEKEGLIFCISDDQELLDDGFRLFANERKEYRYTPKRVIYTAEKKDLIRIR